jgi:CRISPR-associated protein Cas2
MWLYCFFDLPTETKVQRKTAARFRKDLLKDGFTMMQFSVYIRHCASNESGTVHINRIKEIIPVEGLVSIIKVTDKQFGESINFVGRKRKPPPQAYNQLEFF